MQHWGRMAKRNGKCGHVYIRVPSITDSVSREIGSKVTYHQKASVCHNPTLRLVQYMLLRQWRVWKQWVEECSTRAEDERHRVRMTRVLSQRWSTSTVSILSASTVHRCFFRVVAVIRMLLKYLVSPRRRGLAFVQRGKRRTLKLMPPEQH